MNRISKRLISILIISILTVIPVLSLTGCDKSIVYVEMKVMDFGTVILELYPDVAPKTVENFTNLVEEGFYDGLTFHRILSNFMIQGGMPNQDSRELEPIYGEFSSNGFKNNLLHKRGVISMARTSMPNSATSQFFICNADYPSLDGEYAAFGRVIEGMDVIDAITAYGMQYTSYAQNGFIYFTQFQPVIESMCITER